MWLHQSRIRDLIPAGVSRERPALDFIGLSVCTLTKTAMIHFCTAFF